MNKHLKWSPVPTFIALFLATWLSSSPALQLGDPAYGPIPTTWTNKAACGAAQAGVLIRVTDVGGYDGSSFGGSIWVCNGSAWVPLTGMLLLCNFSAEVVTTNTSETVLSTCPVKGGVMGPKGSLLVLQKVKATGANGARSQKVRMCGSGTDGTQHSGSAPGNTILNSQNSSTIFNKNSESSQESQQAAMTNGFSGTSTNLPTTGSCNTGSDFNVYANGNVTSGDTLTQTLFQVWLIRN